MPYPLTMTDRDVVPPPCVACRRRLHVNGKQVFTNCCCQSYGPPVTVLSLALGAAALAALALAVARTPQR